MFNTQTGTYQIKKSTKTLCPNLQQLITFTTEDVEVNQTVARLWRLFYSYVLLEWTKVQVFYQVKFLFFLQNSRVHIKNRIVKAL